jgi:hypothetical protein
VPYEERRRWTRASGASVGHRHPLHYPMPEPAGEFPADSQWEKEGREAGGPPISQPDMRAMSGELREGRPWPR